MEVTIVDRTESRYAPRGRMEAVIGMKTTGGSEIISVGADSCVVEGPGYTRRVSDVAIDIKEALDFGWGAPDGASRKAAKSKGAKALERNAEAAAPKAEVVKLADKRAEKEAAARNTPAKKAQGSKKTTTPKRRSSTR